MVNRAAFGGTKQPGKKLPMADRDRFLQRFVALEQLAQAFLAGRSFDDERENT